MRNEAPQIVIRSVFVAAFTFLICGSVFAKTGQQQVLLDTRFVEINQKAVDELGLDKKIADVLAKLPANASDLSATSSPNLGFGPNPSAQTIGTRLFPDEEAGPIRLSGLLTDEQLEAIVNAVSREKGVKIFSAPTLVTPNGQGAVVDTSSIPGLRDFGVTLGIVPRVVADGKGIELALTPEVSGLGRTTHNVTVGAGKVPVLGEIPILGRLFRGKTAKDQKSHLLILVTPRLVSALGGSGYRDDDVQVETGGTGETVGHVANLKIQNMTDQPLDLYIPALILESKTGEDQDYVCPEGKMVTLGSRQTETIPVDGVCINRDKPPVGKGVVGTLAIHSTDPNVPPHAGCHIPGKAAGDLVRICNSIYTAVAELQKEGAFKNFPYSDKQEQKNILVQWSTWSNPTISNITHSPAATQDDLKKVVYKQAEAKGPMTPATKKKIDQGIETIFDKVELTSAKAKDLENPPDPAAGQPVSPAQNR